MVGLCLYFQIHQPRRLRRYSAFDNDSTYFDDETNEKILHKVADKCYLPATELLLELLRKHEGKFRVAFSVTGSAIDQFRAYCPKMIDRLKAVAQTGNAEFLAETYHHSLASQYSAKEFEEQVRLHEATMFELFGVRPTVFRNTELVYDNGLTRQLAKMGKYKAVLCEGVEKLLDGRSPNHVYTAPQFESPKLLLKNHVLSDDIAFRFSDRSWAGWPLTAEKFAANVSKLPADTQTVNLFMDYETFGEHQWADTGIFQFLECLPERILNLSDHQFLTPSETVEQFEPVGEYDAAHPTSWADTERDLSAWLGNAMQISAMRDVFQLEKLVKESNDEQVLRDWRCLTTSDHFYYMCTKYFSDGQVHKYFSPYESPYDSYINFMNVLDNLKIRLGVEVV